MWAGAMSGEVRVLLSCWGSVVSGEEAGTSRARILIPLVPLAKAVRWLWRW